MQQNEFKFSEGFIQDALNGFFSFSAIKYNMDNLYVFGWESDKLLETKSGYIYEFEIKISKSDFKNDFKNKKDKHIILEGEEKYGDKYLPKYYEFLEINRKNGTFAERAFHDCADNDPRYLVGGHKRPNYFYYAVPENLISVDEVPEYAGLVYVTKTRRLVVVKKAPKIHCDKYSDVDLNLCEKFYYNMVNWKSSCNRAQNESKQWKEKFKSELEAKGHGIGYSDMENMLESYKRMYNQLEESSKKSISNMQRSICEKSHFIHILTKEIKKLNPEFDIVKFENENML